MDFTLDKKLLGFRQIAQEKLQSILCSIPDNQKDLVIDTCLIKQLEHVCGASWLRFVVLNQYFDSKIWSNRKNFFHTVQMALTKSTNSIRKIHHNDVQQLFI